MDMPHDSKLYGHAPRLGRCERAVADPGGWHWHQCRLRHEPGSPLCKQHIKQAERLKRVNDLCNPPTQESGR